MDRLAGEAASLDFAALNTLLLVHRLGSFTAAAEHLGVNQSGVSYTISKLRRCFHDPLFVREAGRQVPTRRCEGLLAQAGQMLDMLDLMAQPEVFDPAGSDLSVTIACNYYERILLIPRIVSALRKEAPNLSIRVINALGDGHLRLLNHDADLLVGPLGRTDSGFHSRRIHSEEYACLMDPSHPDAGRALTVEEYLTLNHLLIDYGMSWKSAYLHELEAAGHTLRPALIVPSPAGLRELLAGSSLVATVPRRLGERIAADLVMGPSPFKGRFEISAVWTARTHRSAMHRWLRELVLESCSE